MGIKIYSSTCYNDYFHQGIHFLDAAWRCYGEKDGNNYNIMKNGVLLQIPAPCIVNAAFSCEMFLKSILLKYKIPLSKTHGLYDLYSKLPSEVQGDIEEEFGDEFKQTLKKHNTDFVDIRYFIEQEGWQEMSPMIMISVAESLSKIVIAYIKSDQAEVNKND